MVDGSSKPSPERIPKFTVMRIRKRTILLSVIVLMMVAGAVYGVILIPKDEVPRNEVLLSTAITLTKLDSEKYYNFDLTKGDNIQIYFSVTGDRIYFKVYNSTFTYISIYGELSWSYLWPPAASPYKIPSGRYTFWFKTLGDNSTVTIRLVRNPS